MQRQSADIDLRLTSENFGYAPIGAGSVKIRDTTDDLERSSLLVFAPYTTRHKQTRHSAQYTLIKLQIAAMFHTANALKATTFAACILAMHQVKAAPLQARHDAVGYIVFGQSCGVLNVLGSLISPRHSCLQGIQAVTGSHFRKESCGLTR